MPAGRSRTIRTMETAEPTGNPVPTRNPPRSLPRGPHRLDPAVVAASQRIRMLEAMSELVSERGYAAVNVADVINLAGVSRKTFYQQFSNKQACFLAAFDHYAAELDSAIVSAAVAVGSPRDRLRAGYAALLNMLAAHPAQARVFTVVAAEAGPAAQQRRAQWLESSVHRLRLLYGEAAADPAFPGVDDLPEYIARAVVGAVDALVVHHLETRPADTLGQLLPTIADIAHQLMTADIARPTAQSDYPAQS